MQSPVVSDSSATVVASSATMTPAAKKRGRPPKTQESAPDIQWTGEMVEEMLEFKQLHRKCFLDSKNKNTIAKGWTRIADSMNTTFRINIAVDKVKRKFQDVQRLYRQI